MLCGLARNVKMERKVRHEASGSSFLRSMYFVVKMSPFLFRTSVLSQTFPKVLQLPHYLCFRTWDSSSNTNIESSNTSRPLQAVIWSVCARIFRGEGPFVHQQKEVAANMACTGFRHPMRCLLREAQSTKDISGFLVPAFGNAATRQFSTSSPRSSRIGMAPISVPPDVNLRIVPLPRGNAKSRHVDTPTSSLEVTGPQGTNPLFGFSRSAICKYQADFLTLQVNSR